jgi:hypothetical protein
MLTVQMLFLLNQIPTLGKSVKTATLFQRWQAILPEGDQTLLLKLEQGIGLM